MSKVTSCSCGKYVSVFYKGKIIGMDQGEIASKIEGTTKIVQRIIKNWKDSGDPSSSIKKCCWKKILKDRDRKLLKHLVKSYRKTAELRVMFNTQNSRSISICTM